MGYFETFADFLQMGKHGLYVWLSYSIWAVIVIYNILSVIFSRRHFFNQAKRRLRREQRDS